jgi:hypothetical protein
MSIHAEHVAPVTLPRSGGRLGLSVWCLVAAFGTYFCMYAFRKPFTAAEYAGYSLWGWELKTMLVATQVLGYTISKFMGIKIIAEMAPSRRAVMILALIGVAEAALLLFAVVPAPYNFVCLFLNGLPLGMVFGLVLGFLEGRRVTEALNAGLCASFILADGVTKSVGAYLLAWGIGQFWMPFLAGLLFVPPLGLGVWMLARIPPPDAADVAHRSVRMPMNGADRSRFFARYAGGLSLLVSLYLLITVLRSIRADFAPELWRGLGIAQQPSVFTSSEMLVALGVMLVNGMSVLILDNRRAFFVALGTCGAGILLLAVALVGQASGSLGGFAFMVLSGLGLYLPYVAVHTTIFERLIAMTRDRGNIGYLMYLADAFGYLGYVAVMFGKGVFAVHGEFLAFFTATCGIITAGAALLLLGAWWYFADRCPVTDARTPAVACKR